MAVEFVEIPMVAPIVPTDKDFDGTEKFATAVERLNTLLNAGFTPVGTSTIVTHGNGIQWLAMVLYKPDAPPEKAVLPLMEQLENAAPGIAGHHLKLKRAGYMEVRIKDVESVPGELRGKTGITSTYGFDEGGMMGVTFSDGTRTAHIPAEHLEPVVQTEKPS